MRRIVLSLVVISLLTVNVMMLSNSEVIYRCAYGEGDAGIDACVELQGGLGYAPTDAESAVDRILEYSGEKMNFTVRACNGIDNAFAVIYKSKRIILYDKSFMDRLNKSADSDWASWAVLAHEIGHHVYNHQLSNANQSQKRQEELAADSFSGFALCRLGTNLERAQSGIRGLPDVRNEESSSHPRNERRLAAIKAGFDRCSPQQPNASPAQYTYKISGWIDSLVRGTVVRTTVSSQSSNHKPKFTFPGQLYKLLLNIEQYTNGNLCASCQLRESPYMSCRIGETVDDSGRARPTFQGGCQVEGYQLAVYLAPSSKCN